MKAPTSHDIARFLLALPDLPLIAENDCVMTRLVDAEVQERASWSDDPGRGEAWVDDGRAVVLVDVSAARFRGEEGQNA